MHIMSRMSLFIEYKSRMTCNSLGSVGIGTAVIDSDGEERQVEAHVPDPGRMKELLLPSVRLRLRRAVDRFQPRWPRITSRLAGAWLHPVRQTPRSGMASGDGCLPGGRVLPTA